MQVVQFRISPILYTTRHQGTAKIPWESQTLSDPVWRMRPPIARLPYSPWKLARLRASRLDARPSREYYVEGDVGSETPSPKAGR